jgi:O-antigen/teichoic acid export membrane protein
MAKGAVWMVLLKLIQRGLGLISTIILARLLVPADFGLVAMAMSFIAILELFGAFGFDLALIQNPSAERRHYDTAWTFNVLFAAGIAAMLVVFAVPLSHFYNEPRLPPILYVLAVASATQGFENIGVVAFRKELEFHKEFRYLLGKKLASFAVTVPLAFTIGNYWALVIGILTGRCAEIALSYYAHPYRPRFSLAGRKELFHFSKWLAINNMLFFSRERAADFVIGRLSGAHSLGLFSIGYEIANLPATELVAPVNRAMYPGYARIAGVLADLRHRYLQVVSMIALIVLPAAVGLSLTAGLFVPVLLGDKWAETIGLIQVIALYGGIVALQSNNGPVFLALGNPRAMTALGTVSLAILLPLLITLTQWRGTPGAATAFLAAALIMMPINYSVVFRHLEMSVGQLLGAIWRPLAACGAMALVLAALQRGLPAPEGFVAQAGQLTLAVGAGAGSYIAAVLLLWFLSGRPAGAERLLIENLWPMIRARLPRAGA